MSRSHLFAAAALALFACGRGGQAEAEQAVRTYQARLIEAYRTSDASLVDPLVSEKQGLKLVGLIGVKQDAGVALDAKILDLQFTRVAREGDRWVVETRERWYYVDRKLKSGQPVGQDSSDSYTMRYAFSSQEGRLILEDLEFLEPPKVGRTSAPVPTDLRLLHGLRDEAAPAGPASPEGRGGGGPPPGHPRVEGLTPPPGHPRVPGASPGGRTAPDGQGAPPARKP